MLNSQPSKDQSLLFSVLSALSNMEEDWEVTKAKKEKKDKKKEKKAKSDKPVEDEAVAEVIEEPVKPKKRKAEVVEAVEEEEAVEKKDKKSKKDKKAAQQPAAAAASDNVMYREHPATRDQTHSEIAALQEQWCIQVIPEEDSDSMKPIRQLEYLRPSVGVLCPYIMNYIQAKNFTQPTPIQVCFLWASNR